jgi:chromate transporter
MTNKYKIQYLFQLAVTFLKLGSIAFGGMPVMISMLEQEFVVQKKWLTNDKLLDLLGASNLIPGPTAVQMALQIGYLQAGWWGFIISGISFIFPPTIITIALGWIYTEFGSLPQVAHFWNGMKAAVLAVIFVTIWKLGKSAAKNWRLTVVGIFVIIISIAGMNEIVAVLTGTFAGLLWLRFGVPSDKHRAENVTFNIPKTIQLLLVILPACVVLLLLIDIGATNGLSLWTLSLFFLRVGSLLYGGGYVLIAFIQDGLVHNLGWLTNQQLLDAIAVGQITPGPLLSTATFIGYLLLGIPGALIATASIFLPSFLFSAAFRPFIPHIRRFRLTFLFLDAINISSVAVIAAVTFKLSLLTLTNWQSNVIAISACIIGFYYKVNVNFLIVGGAIAGWVLFHLKVSWVS